MAVDLYQIGVSGLLTAQQQLSTTGHNIANVDNEGFTRQRVIQGTQTPHWEGSNYLGTGTYAQEVSRIYDQFAFKEVVFQQSRFSQAEDYHTRLAGLDSNLSRSGTNLLDTVAAFYDAVNAIVDQPNDIGIRQVMLDKANAMAGTFNAMNSNLEIEYAAVQKDIETVAQRMDEIAEQLAQINSDIVAASGAGQGATPNDLLDRRDQLVKELSEYTTVSTVEQPTGAMTVIIGSGQTLVADNTAFSVTTIPGDLDPTDVRIVLEQKGNIVNLDTANIGGKLQAMFDYRDGELKLAMREMGLTAMGIADAMNNLQSVGLDLNETFGNDLFTPINQLDIAQQRVVDATNNTGTEAHLVNITDTNLLTGNEYALRYDAATGYTLTDITNGDSYALGLTGTGPFFPDADGDGESDIGFEIEELGTGPVADGDSWLVKPTRGFAGDIAVEISNPEQIAASSVLAIYPDSGNVSPASVTLENITDVTNPLFPSAGNPLEFVFIENGGVLEYDVLDSTGASVIGGYQPLGATPASIPALPIDLGFTVEVTGNPVGQPPNTPDSFVIEYAFGTGNNLNAIAMANIQNEKLLKDGRATIQDNFQNLNTQIAVKTETAEIQLSTVTITKSDADSRWLGISGVNLDEEASNLLKYQQSYQAAARVVTVAREIVDTLLNAV
ncbi:flagellar hook-associated protein FlgK [Echinimonas agarilytica]|uniref:Flagellar hook-associated protein 1 n=1 Tax=Echinimonas agarilytica TaxID=1215918 RepID=A0AA41W586_9GAMM|nr:flagellar hook-associated protein FlgK [Echinimonas agarilytica]MCM2678944.1 flagellar hook-associated protein FlgK [Echinimonas agarilytica]